MNPQLVLFYPYGHEAHFEKGHPERPERIETIRQALQEGGFWEEGSLLPPIELRRDVLENVHAPYYLQMLPDYCHRGDSLDGDTYTTPHSWDLSLKAAGGAAAVAEAVWAGAGTVRGFALTRPPGHHATGQRGMGFCLLNNVALAAEHLLRLPQGERPSRLAILDLDLHHGNGTQNIFWRRGDVFYLSTHQSPLYPGSGRLEETGDGAGEGCTANFPLPPGSGDRSFRTVMEELILPLLNRYRPEMLLISYGFDPHWRDPLGSLCLSSNGYARLIKTLVEWAETNCQGRIALFLEGGYDLAAAADTSRCVTAALLGQPWKDQLGPSPYAENGANLPMLRQAKSIWGL